MRPKIILGIETSCDETAAAVLTNDQKRITILSNVVASSAALQAKYGGVIPEQAAREQIKSIIPVIEETLSQAFLLNPKPHTLPPPIDAIAVTYGPGLIGSLLVGVETAKTLALVWNEQSSSASQNKPLIPVNHLIGHFYANWIGATPRFPCVGLLISGGHSDLVLFKNHGKYKYLGGTRDDAAGECFDKCARLLGLPYPGGPEIAKLTQKGNPKAFDLPRPMIDSDDFDFSFSGLKTAVANLIRENSIAIPANAGIQLNNASSELDPRLRGDDNQKLTDLAASIQQAIVDVLVSKTIKAAQMYKVDQIMIAGGVAANQKLVSELAIRCQSADIRLSVPPVNLCTDNAAMIAAAAFFNYHPTNPLTLQVNPNLSLR